MSYRDRNYKENDFAMRIRAYGGLIVAEPAAWVIHLRAPTGGYRPNDTAFAEWTQSYNYLWWVFRHGGKVVQRGSGQWFATP
jgi:hypothetical protein